MMTAPFTARCAQGRLILTSAAILVERGNVRSQTLSRSSLTALDMRMTLLFPFLSRYRLTFHGAGGERLVASSVRSRDAKRVKRLLTGR